MTSVTARVRCEHCGHRQPRKHWKTDAKWRTLYALLCPACARAAGWWPINYEHPNMGPNGRTDRIA